MNGQPALEYLIGCNPIKVIPKKQVVFYLLKRQSPEYKGQLEFLD